MKCRHKQRIARLEAARSSALECLRIHRENIRSFWASHPLPLPGEPMSERAERGAAHRAAARELACEAITTVRAIDATIDNIRDEMKWARIRSQVGMA